MKRFLPQKEFQQKPTMQPWSPPLNVLQPWLTIATTAIYIIGNSEVGQLLDLELSIIIAKEF